MNLTRFLKLPNLPDPLQNEDGLDTSDPFHLLKNETVFQKLSNESSHIPLVYDWRINTRFWFHSFEVSVSYLTLLWCLLTLVIAAKQGLKLRRGQQEHRMERHEYLMRLVSRIREARKQQIPLNGIEGRKRPVQPVTIR